jgi:hypothetical protein
VIGENMKDRVKPMAQLYKAEVFDVPWTNEADMLKRNEDWLRKMLPKAERVIDLGIDPEREVRSKFYGMESQVMREFFGD